MSGESRARIAANLALILLVCLGLRVWYASEALRIDRFMDERYSLENVRSIVTTGTLEPANHYYPYPFFNLPPAILLEGSETLSEWTGNSVFETMPQGGYGAATFLLIRLLQVAYGCLGVLLVFLVGREVFTPEVGLIGALAVAWMPWHIHASGYFKPDVQLATMSMLAFYISLRAVERPAVRTYFLAAVAVALAASSKLLGVLSAVPLVAGTLAHGWRDKRRLRLLLLAGTAGVVLYALINPYWRQYPGWLRDIESDYAMRAARQGMTRWQIPGRVADLITDPYVLGPVLGLCGLGAVAVLAFRWARPRFPEDPRPEKTRHLMFVVFPLAYVAAYAWRTPYFKANNFVPVLPFFALASAWALVETWRWLESWAPARSTRWARGLALLVLLGALGWPGFAYTYRATTPTTMDKALAFVGRRLRPADGRMILVEQLRATRTVWEGRRRFGAGRSRVESVADWREIPDHRRLTADAVIVAPGHADPTWVEGLSNKSRRLFEPRLFRLRGSPLIAMEHGWRRVEIPLRLPLRQCRPRGRCFVGVVPGTVEEATRASFVVSIGRARGELLPEPIDFRVGGRRVDLLQATTTEREAVYLTEKILPLEREVQIVFVAARRLRQPRRLGIELHQWIADR